VDNQAVLDLIEHPQSGLLAKLCEECFLPVRSNPFTRPHSLTRGYAWLPCAPLRSIEAPPRAMQLRTVALQSSLVPHRAFIQ
jgi:hypothetical protein